MPLNVPLEYWRMPPPDEHTVKAYLEWLQREIRLCQAFLDSEKKPTTTVSWTTNVVPHYATGTTLAGPIKKSPPKKKPRPKSGKSTPVRTTAPAGGKKR